MLVYESRYPVETNLAGGFNPPEKYESQIKSDWIIIPTIGEHKSI